MARHVSVPFVWILIVWLIIGVIVAINKGYGDTLDNADQIATFLLAVVLWPVPATGGQVGINFGYLAPLVR
jgi:hypothetical protein